MNVNAIVSTGGVVGGPARITCFHASDLTRLGVTNMAIIVNARIPN